jgi:hypothetical protein
LLFVEVVGAPQLPGVIVSDCEGRLNDY